MKLRPLIVLTISTLAVFAALELLSRALGLDDLERFGGSSLKYQLLSPPLLRPVPNGYRPRDPRLADRHIPAAAPGHARVFVFGESAVAGLGMSENVSFPRAAERMLRTSGRAVSVVNMGLVALSSRQIARAVHDVLHTLQSAGDELSRDVFVFHVCNNEFFEPQARAFADAQGLRTWRARLSESLERHSGVYRAMAVLSARLRPEAPRLRELMNADRAANASDLVKNLTLSEEVVSRVLQEHADNLRASIAAVREAGAIPVLMTVGANLLWLGKGGVTSVEGDWSRARQEGAELLARGEFASAKARLEFARSNDPHRRRCTAEMNESIRALAAETGTLLVDSERALESKAKGGAPGFEFFYDHIHFSLSGAEAVADSLVAALAPGLPAGEATQEPALDPGPVADALELERWVGFNDDRQMLEDDDLWKFERMRARFEEKAGRPGATPAELIWAANGHALETGGLEAAERLYERALGAGGEAGRAAERNLNWLRRRERGERL
ncbi:MAG TPA: hypothetical protein VFV50_06465 [Bdellovibrionales bacterium]|nr:hypothetical protein [Bdellovibrionales bacterium]